MEQESQIKRQTAHKILIRDILNSEYFKEEGWTPNYLKTNRGNISKVNVIGIIISKDNGMVIDDSTGTLPLRTFESQEIFNIHHVGEIVLVIGKPREFNNSKYVAPDIIKKIDPAWMKVRMKEFGISLTQNNDFLIEKEVLSNVNTTSYADEEKFNSLNVVQEKNDEDNNLTSYDKIVSWIEKNDSGNGVGIDDIIMNSNIENCEKIINSLLEEGEIFEIRPGIVKVL